MDLHEPDIVELFRLKIIDYIPEFELRQIDYTIDIPEKRIGMPVNAVQFNRALDNLIQNSIKYLLKSLHRVFRLAGNGTAFITISDNGIGIPRNIPTGSLSDDPGRRSRNTEGWGGTGVLEKDRGAHNGEISLDALIRPAALHICLPKTIGPAVSNGRNGALKQDQ
jgi:signal transduction histidine kinase